jgi:hypothetical protein
MIQRFSTWSENLQKMRIVSRSKLVEACDGKARRAAAAATCSIMGWFSVICEAGLTSERGYTQISNLLKVRQLQAIGA